MKTVRVTPANRAETIAAAARILTQGGVIILPTDTVYGIACHPDFPDALRRIYRIKARDAGKPVAFLASGADTPVRYGARLSPDGTGQSVSRPPRLRPTVAAPPPLGCLGAAGTSKGAEPSASVLPAPRRRATRMMARSARAAGSSRAWVSLARRSRSTSSGVRPVRPGTSSLTMREMTWGSDRIASAASS